MLTGLSLSSSASAQDISGTWHGKLTVPTGSLTLVFHINQTGEGTYITTLDSPDQGANGIKTQTTSFKDSILTVQTPVIHASYKGKLSNDRSISGTFTQGIPLPLNLEKGEASRSKRPQEPQPPFSYKSEEVTVRNEQDGINLAGTFTLPEKGTKFPAVVMVTGSGAQNRDEEIMGHKPFLVIADYLTRNGIAVLRCDDRGTAASQGNHATATNEDLSLIHISEPKGDSLMLRQVELISKSQGMPDALWQGTKPSLRNRYAILQQADKTTDELQKELYADVTKTMSSEQLKDLNTVQQISAQIRSMTSPWYLHFMRYDPANALKNVKCPVLALNGEKDIQVDATMNLTAIQQRISENGNKNVTVKAYPNLNHLLQTCEKGTLAEYGQLEETISPEVLKDMTEWIQKQ